MIEDHRNAYLVDTSILLRVANASDVLYPSTFDAVSSLRRQNQTLCIAPQNLIEFRNAATRAASDNGLGRGVRTTSGRV
jgi:hypothetical protein